jgi:hypothetical protein
MLILVSFPQVQLETRRVSPARLGRWDRATPPSDQEATMRAVLMKIKQLFEDQVHKRRNQLFERKAAPWISTIRRVRRT